MVEKTFEERKAETESVLDLLLEAGGEDLASHWAWEMTPMPCGLPSDEQKRGGSWRERTLLIVR